MNEIWIHGEIGKIERYRVRDLLFLVDKQWSNRKIDRDIDMCLSFRIGNTIYHHTVCDTHKIYMIPIMW